MGCSCRDSVSEVTLAKDAPKAPHVRGTGTGVSDGVPDLVTDAVTLGDTDTDGVTLAVTEGVTEKENVLTHTRRTALLFVSAT